ncbi:unnamed protein product [Urochloa humidicola]
MGRDIGGLQHEAAYESSQTCKQNTVSIKVRHGSDVGPHISMVRAQLRGHNDDGIFTPHYMPIGPYHLHRSSPSTDKEKKRCVCLLESLCEKRLADVTEELEPLARECYDADRVSDMTQEQLSNILLNDGCYLLLFFVDYMSGTGGGAPPLCDDHERPAAAVSRNTLVRDTVFLLENQIPFFVLQSLHERVTGGTSSVLDYIAGPVQELLQKMLFISNKPRHAPPPPCSHLLDLVHGYFQPAVVPMPAVKSMEKLRCRRPSGRWRRATEYLRYANTRFRLREFADDEESSVLDVELQRGTVWVPRLRIDSNTWTVLRNLMALEEQAAHRRRPVTAYCLFMSQVACTVEDVELLRRAGIVDHFLSNDGEVARGFADLCNGVVMDVDDSERNYLKTMWHELEERCDSRVHRFMGWLCQRQNLGIAAAFLAALILVVCQVMQTFYAATARGQQPY